MKRSKIVKTLKGKLILCNLIITIFIASFVSMYNFVSYREDTIDIFVQNSLSNTENISSRLNQAYNEMLNIILNSIERKSLFISIYNNDLETSSGRRISLYGAQVLNDYIAISGYSKYIDKVILYHEDGLLLQAGASYGTIHDVPNVLATSWFTTELNKIFNNYQLSIYDSPFAKNEKIIPILRRLNYEILEDDTVPGWMLLSISSNLYKNVLVEYKNGNEMYCMTSDGTIIASVNGLHSINSKIIHSIMNTTDNHAFLQKDLDGENSFITYTKDAQSGIVIFEIIPTDTLDIDHSIILQTILFISLSCIGIGLLLSIIISNRLNKPISRLLHGIESISHGDFSYQPKIEGDDEIGSIGLYVNVMSSQIKSLMHSRVQNEKEKKNLEIRMLQAQINPHFLYNTLDSIRWMAVIQKNSGIVKMVTSLSSLYKNMAKGINEKITLEQELDFLNNYITIQKIRYMQLFDVEIDINDVRLYQAKIVKLTLQPIVENAIFNGIEPSGHSGMIRISAFTKDNTLFITIRDDGVGIPSEKISTILTKSEPTTSDTMNGIGLPNVAQRLKLVYGEEFGISIESELGTYTSITVSLPVEYD